MLLGREYWREPMFLFKILRRNFGVKKKISPVTIFFLKIYLRIFGFPDIGFQSRAHYFQKIIKGLNFTKILDAGTGSGVYANYLYYHFPKAVTYAIDINKEMIKQAKKLFPSRIHFTLGDILYLKKRNYFDLIVCIDVLEHILDNKKALKNFSQALESKGKLIIHVPKRKFYLYFNSLPLPQHSQHRNEGFSVSELKNKLKIYNFKINKIQMTIGPLEELGWELNWFFIQKTPYIICGLFYPLWFLLAWIDRLFIFTPEKYRGFFIIAEKN